MGEGGGENKYQIKAKDEEDDRRPERMGLMETLTYARSGNSRRSGPELAALNFDHDGY